MWKVLFLTLAVFLVFDGVYFTLNRSFLSSTISSVQGGKIRMRYGSVVLTYCVMVFMEYYFILRKRASLVEAFALGAGIYGIYEFTNYATLERWPLALVAMDTIWGGVLFAMTTHVVRCFT